ncbi:MAG: hypothetical protein TR69_WS6001000883 [candidate division WS6 bacterium OLB20]|uniref:Uncharacterized protein n=1 Tax=candidate division WS6 bacterium OLB20 TaxID=1617426 RepID=A0A136LYW8_9BACT|nr:MAG: hypothetical protein TR69_WS6001000883 [candidate division WS6 bacterium OLB20]
MSCEYRTLIDVAPFKDHTRGLYVPQGYDQDALDYLHRLDSIFFKPQNMLCANTLQLTEIAMLTRRYAGDDYASLFNCSVSGSNPDIVLTIPDVHDIMQQRRLPFLKGVAFTVIKEGIGTNNTGLAMSSEIPALFVVRSGDDNELIIDRVVNARKFNPEAMYNYTLMMDETMQQIESCFAGATTDLEVLPSCLADYGISLDLDLIPYTACTALVGDGSSG